MREQRRFGKVPLTELLARLPAGAFLQVHRGFAVQVAAIQSFDPQRAELTVGPHQVPVGRSYREVLTARLSPLC